MANTTWPRELRAIYDKAVAAYRDGKRSVDDFFTAEEKKQLAAIGLNAQIVYDYAEDAVNHGEPEWETFLLVAAARRDYFLYEMKGAAATELLDSSTLPAKTDEMDGVVWLPRVIKKARAFLQGALPSETMYGCGGDRKFFADNRVHSADFLRAVWGAKGDDGKILEFVRSRQKG